jgi:hypothetical protein
MKFFYCAFKDYKKLPTEVKHNFLFLSTAVSDPWYFKGFKFLPFVPSKQIHDGINTSHDVHTFFVNYTSQINSLNRTEIINALKQFQEEIIIFLVWEDESKKSERDIFIPWLTQTSLKDIKSFSFLLYLHTKEILAQSNIFDI